MITRFFRTLVREYRGIQGQDGRMTFAYVKAIPCHIRQSLSSITQNPYGAVEYLDAVMYSAKPPDAGNYIRHGNQVYRVMRVSEVKDMSTVRFYSSALERVDGVTI